MGDHSRAVALGNAQRRTFVSFHPLTIIKEKAFEVVVRSFLNHKLQQYGVMTKLELDSKAKTIRVELDLRGETVPILIEAGSYAVTEVNGQTFLSVDKFKTSREWLTTMLNEYVVKKPLPIPKAAGIAL
jgi:hypothetical protein